MSIFDDVWVEIYRDKSNGKIMDVQVCDNAGHRIMLPIVHYEVDQNARDIGIAKLSLHHGRIEYK